MAECHPEPVIEQFAKFSSLGGITRGEQGLVVSLNTRWLSHLVRHRQALGLEPVRLNFAPTSHDPLAQSPGKFTFHFDADRGLWECLGALETGADTFVLPADTKLTRAEDVPAAWEEIGRAGVESGQPIRWTMRPIMARDSRNRSGPASLPPGKYRLRLLLADPSSTAPGQRVFDVQVSDDGLSWSPVKNLRRKKDNFRLTDRVDIFQLAGQPNRIIVRKYDLTLGPNGAVDVKLTPVQGQAIICGAVLEPCAVTPAQKPGFFGEAGRTQTFSPLKSNSSSLFSLISSSIVRQPRRAEASRPSTAVSASSAACCTVGLSNRPSTMF